jgi:hypothetical protein
MKRMVDDPMLRDLMPFDHFVTFSDQFKDAIGRALRRAVEAHACRHVDLPSEQLVPVTALLGPDIISCGSCFGTFVTVIQAYGSFMVSGLDQRCDVCRNESGRFRPFGIPLGPVEIFGHMCDTCWHLSGGEGDLP